MPCCIWYMFCFGLVLIYYFLIFPNKMGLFGNNKELQFKTCGLNASHVQVQRNKGEGCCFMDLGGAVVNKEFIGENENFQM